MKHFFNYSRFFYSIPIQKLIKLSGENLFLPFLHTVSNEPLLHINQIYPVRNEALFNRDIETILKYFKPITLSTLTEYIHEQKPFTEPVFHLTFDDGLKENYSVVAPVLEKHKIPATFFVNTAFIDNKSLFYRYKVSLLINKIYDYDFDYRSLNDVFHINIVHFDQLKSQLLTLQHTDTDIINHIAERTGVNFDEYLHEEKPYMTSKQINELLDRGFNVGSHSTDHPFFRDLTPEKQKEQVTDSYTTLQQLFELKSHFFSFPFSDEGVSAGFFEWLHTDAKCLLSFGTSGLKYDCIPNHLHRVAFDGSSKEAEEIIKTSYINFLIKMFIRRNTIHR